MGGLGRDAANFIASTGKPLALAVPQDDVAAPFLKLRVPVFASDRLALRALDQLAAHTALMRRRRKAGVTLVESVLAAVLLSVAAVALVNAYFSSHLLSEHADTAMTASNDLEDLMEHIHATPFNQLQTRFPANEADGGGVTDYSALVGGYTLHGERIVVTYPVQTPTRLEVVATITWSHRGRAMSSSLSTVKMGG